MILDAVSSLQSAFFESLKFGLIRNCKFNLEFRRDVFMFLFNGKGKKCDRKRGFMYESSDFDNNYFCDDFFVFYDKFGESCTVDFPIYMFSYVKFFPVRYDNNAVTLCCRDFREIVSISIVKKYC